MYLRILSDKGIKKLIEEEKLVLTPFPDAEQFQTCSIDFKIDSIRVYDTESLKKNNEELLRLRDEKKSFLELIEAQEEIGFAYKEYTKDAFIPSKTMFEVFLKEKMLLDKNYKSFFELRSSRGRMIQEPSSIHTSNENNKDYVRVTNNNINDIVLHCGSKFLQKFIVPPEKSFYSGELVQSFDEAKELFPEFDDDYISPRGELLFKVDKVLRFNKLDNPYVAGEKYDGLTVEQEFVKDENVLFANQSHLLGLHPKIDTKNTTGVMLMHANPYVYLPFRNRVVCAGWVDPGYKGPITAHYHGFVDRSINKEYPVVAAKIYKFNEGAIENLYGSDVLNSHYKDVKKVEGSNN